jgi:hypothetical protein
MAASAAGLVLVVATPAAATPRTPYGPGPQAHYAVAAQPAAGSCHYRHTRLGQPLPDVRCTPGALNPKVTQATLVATICRKGYTATIRPSSSVTAREKRANAASYGYAGRLGDAEYDHLISLELGGDPNDARNLWVEPPSPGHLLGTGPRNPKDTIENQAHALICSGKVTLAAMQRAIAVNWTTALAVVGHARGR